MVVSGAHSAAARKHSNDGSHLRIEESKMVDVHMSIKALYCIVKLSG